MIQTTKKIMQKMQLDSNDLLLSVSFIDGHSVSSPAKPAFAPVA